MWLLRDVFHWSHAQYFNIHCCCLMHLKHFLHPVHQQSPQEAAHFYLLTQKHIQINKRNSHLDQQQVIGKSKKSVVRALIRTCLRASQDQTKAYKNNSQISLGLRKARSKEGRQLRWEGGEIDPMNLGSCLTVTSRNYSSAWAASSWVEKSSN